MRVPTSGAWDQRGQTGQQTVLAFFVTMLSRSDFELARDHFGGASLFVGRGLGSGVTRDNIHIFPQATSS